MSGSLSIVAGADAPASVCCAACEASAVAAEAAGTASRLPIDRELDRRITGFSVGIAALFVAAGVLAGIVSAASGGAAWLPLHLVLAGAAGTATAGVLPFYTTALAAAAPASPRARLAAVGLIAGGAVVVTVSVGAGSGFLGHVGGSLYLGGLVLVTILAFAPLRGALGIRRPLVEGGYAAGLLAAVLAVALATTFLAGWDPVVERWAALKPAHVWLNLIGFLSVVIVATLVHLAPTVEGSRLQPRRSAVVAVVGLALGAALVAAGYVSGSDLVARAGAVAALAGAVAVVVHTLAVRPARSPWTTDAAWHRMITWSLRAASAWFLTAMIVMAGRVLSLGAAPAAWSLALIGIPFVAGWALQVIIGSWTHLVPVLGPGDPDVRARRRERLGRAATPRIAALNGGAAMAWVGVAAGWSTVALAGGGLVAVALGTAVALAGWAVHAGRN